MATEGTAVKASSLVGGEWIQAGQAGIEILDPATAEEVLRASLAGPEDVDRAVDAARDAQRSWARTSALARSAVLTEAANLLEHRRGRLAARITSEMGKVLAESQAEVDEAVFFLRFMAAEGVRLVGEVRPSFDPLRLAIAERVPAGVVAAITPWNFPLAIPTWKISAALVCGNAVVFKPALQTTGSGAELVDALCSAGLPAGVLNMLVGTGPDTGEALASHPDVRVVTFTGSTAVGRRLAGIVGQRGGRAALELGGKNVAVVLPDADLEHAAERIAAGAFASTGQRCTATSRVVADRRVFDDLVTRLAERAESLAVGPGLDPASDIGPLIDVANRDRIASAVRQATVNGGQIVAGGRVPDNLPPAGAYYRPTIVTGLDAGHPLVRDELFGPVATVLRAADDDEALRLANDTEYGLAASVFTRDVSRALTFARGIAAGMVFVNAATNEAETHLPFGGLGASGNGSRDTGIAALDSYTEWKCTYVAGESTNRPSERNEWSVLHT